MLAASEPAPLVELPDGAVLLLVELVEPSVDVAVAADAEEADLADADALSVARLRVAFLLIAVPVAADPLAPVPIGAVPIGAVPISLVVVVLADVVVLPLLEPPPMTPPDAGFVGTDEVAEPEDEEDVEEVRAEIALVGPPVWPPVSVIMPV